MVVDGDLCGMIIRLNRVLNVIPFIHPIGIDKWLIS